MNPTTLAPVASQQPDAIMPRKTRILSIDLLRGLVMVIMPIDHLRDMLHLGHPVPMNLHTTTAALFFTRWITHFCAPAFVFLSGISAYLAGRRRSQGELAGFLISRGIWLIFIEVFIINLAASADIFYHAIVLQVIWAIGGSMVLLGLLVKANVSPKVIGCIGLAIILGHNVVDLLHNHTLNTNPIWRLFLTGNGFGTVDPIGPNHFVIIAYALLPWTGVMFAGYALGTLYSQDAGKRRRVLTSIGLAALALFVIFRTFNIYGDPAPWSVQKSTMLSVLSYLRVTKYPCSLLYLCVTLGISLLILAKTEKADNRIARILVVYGNVPFFFYVIHWFLAQAITIILFFSMGHHMSEAYRSVFPYSPNNFGFSLAGVYAVWLLLMILLYFPCRWFGRYKRSHGQWWLSYL